MKKITQDEKKQAFAAAKSRLAHIQVPECEWDHETLRLGRRVVGSVLGVVPASGGGYETYCSIGGSSRKIGRWPTEEEGARALASTVAFFRKAGNTKSRLSADFSAMVGAELAARMLPENPALAAVQEAK